MISHKFNGLEMLSGLFLVTVALFVGLNNLPFDTFVKVNQMDYHDMCVGDTIQIVETQRDVWGVGPVKGETFSELYILDDTTIFETIIKRKTEFTYQYEPRPFSFEIEWSQPVSRVGTYGVQDLVVVHPLPFVHVRSELDHLDKTFEVYECS